MTDRDKLKELLKQAQDKYFELCSEYAKDSEGKTIESFEDFCADHLLANGVIVQEWIPVENKLPDVRENPVLVSYGGGVWMAWRHKGWWELPGGLKTNYVTHWMPLPKPPKERGDKQ